MKKAAMDEKSREKTISGFFPRSAGKCQKSVRNDGKGQIMMNKVKMNGKSRKQTVS
jgi:hypothetical protein